MDEKTYEYSMLRALGMKEHYVVLMVMVEAAIFSVPAICVAFVVAYMLNVVICIAIFEKTTLAGSYWLHPLGFAYGLGVGTVMPVVSNVFPIRRALSKALRDGLDLLRRSLNEVLVQIIRLNSMGLSLAQLTFALTLVACGLIAYYLVPLSIYYKNLESFAFMMNLIFLSMIIGMIIMTVFIVGYVQRAILFVIFAVFRRDKKLSPVVKSNLKGHKQRNLKTSLMYSIALAFLIMTGSNISQLKQLFLAVTKLYLASDLVLLFPPTFRGGLEETQLRNYLEQVKRTQGLIEGYTFISKSLGDATFTRLKSSLVGPLGGYPLLAVMTYGVEENYLRTIDSDYYYPVSFDSSALPQFLASGKQDAVAAVYSDQGIRNEHTVFDKHGILLSREDGFHVEKPGNLPQSL